MQTQRFVHLFAFKGLACSVKKGNSEMISRLIFLITFKKEEYILTI